MRVADDQRTSPIAIGGTSVLRRLRISSAVAASLAGALAVGLLVAPAIAATSNPAAAVRVGASSQAGVTNSVAISAAKLPISARQLLSDRQRHDAAQQPATIVTGIVRNSAGKPLMDICVTAFGAAGHKFAATKADGRFVLAGLRLGKYELEYRSCGGAAHYRTAWYGGSADRSSSQPVLVTGQRVNTLAQMTLHPAMNPFGHANQPFGLANEPFGSAGAATASPKSMGRLILGQLGNNGVAPQVRAAPQNSRTGRIAGTVTGPNGHGIEGICVEAVTPSGYNRGGFTKTGKTGSFRIPGLRAARYEMAFYARCGNQGNWLAQIYKNRYTERKPTLIRVVAGKTTAGIHATMKLGGEISGLVTNAAGKRLSRICVAPVDVSNLRALILGAVTSQGAYRLRGMPAGAYRIAFIPCQSSSVYAPTWLGGTASERASKLVRVKGIRHVQHVNQVMPIGGVISGTVTGATSPTPTPLGGICVFVGESQGFGFFGGQFTTTNKAGKYSVKGLPAGSYQVQFSPGCPNNGNYLSANYPGSVKVSPGQTRSGIDVVLPVGAIVTGTVTSHATGHGLAGICVTGTDNADSQYGFQIQTLSDGSYAVNQLPAGSYTVQFSGGCGDHGNYAPQAFNNANPATPTVFTLKAGQTQIADAAMQPGAIIAGNVTSNTGKPLKGICAVAASNEGYVYSVGTTNSVGHYHAGSLASDLYNVFFTTGCGNKENLTSQVFGRQANGQGPAAISVTTGTTNGINGVLAPAGWISGVLKTKTGKSLPGGCVFVTGETGAAKSMADLTFGDRARYRLSGLPAGSYLVEFQPSCFFGGNYENQWYSRKASPAGATLVKVRAGHTTAGVDSAVVAGGSIAGRITSRGKSVSGACVFAQSITQLSDYGISLSGKGGKYVIAGLNSGRYELQLSPCLSRSAASLASIVVPRLVTVKAPKATDGVNASIPVAGAISGIIRGGTPAVAQDGRCAEAFAVNGLSLGFAETAADGSYQLTNLAPGRYLVYLGDPGCALFPQALAPQWYDNQPTQRTATSVKVTVGADTKIATATLASDGAISGNVTGTGNNPLAGACVIAYSTGQGAAPVYSVTGASGSYAIANLTPGSYKVQFTSGCGAIGYRGQWWQDAVSMSKAKIVTVASGATTPSVNAAMTK
jgi:Carboxypeptidase regulatory-like domain